MGKKVFAAILVWLIAGLGSLALSARAEEKPQLWTLWEFTVKPPKDEAFHKTFKDIVALMAKHKFPYNFYGYYVSEFRYEFSTPLKNYGDIENLDKAFDDMAKKAGDEWNNLWQAIGGTYECMARATGI